VIVELRGDRTIVERKKEPAPVLLTRRARDGRPKRIVIHGRGEEPRA
jgi:hypothetical protein